MAKTQYRVIKPAKPEFEPAKPEFEPRALLTGITHKGADLIVGHPAFGRNTYKANQQEMQGDFFCLPQYPQMSFRPATTSESISIATETFEEITKPQILDPSFLQLGYMGKTSKGVFTNLPTDKQRNLITDEAKLKSLLKGAEKTKVGKAHIYLTDSGLAFVEYDTFETGVQESRVFTEGGLAKGLEHTTQEPKNLSQISSKDNYKFGVNVYGFDPTDELAVRVVGLYSARLSGGDRLLVYGDWSDGDLGYAFGVFDRSAEGASQNSR